MTAHCAVCDQPVHGDEEHVRVDAMIVHVGDRDLWYDYALHPSCWSQETDHWQDPA